MGGIFSVSVSLDQQVNNVFQWLGQRGGYTHNLKKNIEALNRAMDKLKAKRDDLSRRLTDEEDRGRKRLAEFQVWLNSVETIEKKVNAILKNRHVQTQRLCLCGLCSKSLRSSYRYGKHVFLTLREVEELKSEIFEVISEESYEVEERQIPLTIVGQETMLDKAWTHLMKDEVGIMGLYGMGGVGKTTLLTQIINKFSKDRCGFEYVIWVVVSQGLNKEKIQDEIAQNVGLGRDGWNQKSKSQKTDVLYNFLRKKKFVLFLDDIWEKVDLAEIGVPIPEEKNECKVAFTTRSLGVCGSMGVDDPMEVQCLTENEAFDLFRKKVGQNTLDSDPEIPDLARIVARKCCGLPLALNVIGETMSSKKTAREWHYAIKILTSNAAKFSDMKDKILPLLKYSYDDIEDEQVQSCLLYCALYPEDYRIHIEELIEYWISEGIIDGSECTQTAENNGYEIIGSLVRASLLMKYSSRVDEEIVYMHDIVREMALWIASDLGRQKEAFIVHAGIGLRELPKVKNWSIVKRMSLMESKISYLVDSPKCMELTTLLLKDADLRNISSEFFKYMPKLVVLDLSGNSCITELPEGISELVCLQYLNLSRTAISHFPKGLQELKQLIHLDLEHTKLSCIAEILSLHNLKVLKLKGSRSWDLDTLKELESLGHLDTLTISISRPKDLEIILRSHRLSSCTQYLSLDCDGNVESFGISLPNNLDKLRSFHLWNCNIYEIKMERLCSFLSLVKVVIDHCNYLRELTLLMFAPNLKNLNVANADILEDIINKEKVCEGEESGIVPFPKLSSLYLTNLPKLKNIYWSPLPFPCLENMYVFRCPNLRKLPLDSTSGKQGDNGLIINYQDQEWIEGVEWENEDTKTRFLASSQEV